MIPMAVFAWLCVFYNYSVQRQYDLARQIIQISIPVLALSFLVISIRDPHLASYLVKEDTRIENLQAVFLFVASLTFLIAAIRFLRQKHRKLGFVAVGIALVFFVIGMEEISWMQRVLEVESTEFFLENNAQSEINFHNLSTHLFQNIYYLAAFLLLVLLPFFRNSLASLLSKSRLDYLADFLPSKWLVLPFTVMVGFVWPGSYLHPTILIAIFASLFILIYEFDNTIKSKRKNPPRLIAAGMSFIVLVATTYVFMFNNKLSDVRSGAPTEYMETFIAIGILVYAIDFYLRKFKDIKA